MDSPPVVRRKRPRSSLLARTWWIGLLVVAASVVGFWLRPAAALRTQPLAGYISDVGILQSEYRRFHGTTLADRNIEDQFRGAGAMMLRREYLDAAAMLERIATQASVPVVFNNLGVLYAAVNDHSRALNSFREALSRDGSYRPVRDNLDRLKSFLADSANPVSRELEPNNSVQTANLIALDKPAEGEIVDRSGDLDSYRFASPPAPRDVLTIEVANRSATLMPRLRIYDSSGNVADEERSERTAGSSITRYLSLEPNTVIHLQVWGGRSTGGAYVLTVRPLKAYDTYEPNDDVFNAHRITIADAIDANIMDAADTDYFAFVGPRHGSVEIRIRNRSSTLIPAISTFAPDRRISGFGPDTRTPGSDLRHRMEVTSNETYFVQVWSQGNSSGSYSLVVN